MFLRRTTETRGNFHRNDVAMWQVPRVANLGESTFTYEACKTLQWLCELLWAIFSVMSFDYKYQNSFWFCFLYLILRLSNENTSRNRMVDNKNWLGPVIYDLFVAVIELLKHSVVTPHARQAWCLGRGTFPSSLPFHPPFFCQSPRTFFASPTCHSPP